MNVWVALLRGVNVGGHNKLPMAEFRAVLTGLGYGDVTTYIQSGNAVFRADGDATGIAGRIGKAVADRFGFEAHVFVMSRDDLQTALAQNPYPQTEQDPKTLHFLVLRMPAGSVDLDGLQKFATKGEAVQQVGNVIYLHTPNGYGRSDLAARLPKIIKSSMTGRNLRSVQKIAELARAL